MTKLEEIKIGNLQDCWSIIYEEMAKPIFALGVDGDAALREGIRNYGIDRGTKLRARHRSMDMKLNVENMITYFDLPGDPRFKREYIRLDPETRFSHTTVCPIAAKWIEDGNKWLGRIYCEEFHHACFEAYNPHIQNNLSMTLTQDGDNYCRFSVYLRPANMTPEERVECFEEFDPGYKLPEDFKYELVPHKEGYNRLSVIIIYFIAEAAIRLLGEAGEKAVIEGIENTRTHLAAFLKRRAKEVAEPCDALFIRGNMSLDVSFENETVWGEYPDEHVKALVKEYFYDKSSVFTE